MLKVVWMVDASSWLAWAKVEALVTAAATMIRIRDTWSWLCARLPETDSELWVPARREDTSQA